MVGWHWQPRPRCAPANGYSVGTTARLRVVLILTAIILVALAVRAYRLGDRSLWFDEAFGWRMLQFPAGEMLERLRRDNSPPLYYALLRGWAGVFGDSALALRSLSVLCGVAAAVGAYFLTSEALGGWWSKRARARESGLLAAALIAASPFQIRWSWEVRMYAMGAALAMWSSWALLRALRPGARRRTWALYGVLALLFAYTHYYALFSLAVQAVFGLALLLIRAKGRVGALLHEPAFRRGLLTGAFVSAGWMPWLPIFLAQKAQVQAAFWTEPVTGRVLQDACYTMLADPEGPAPVGWRSAAAAAFCAAVVLAVLWRARAGDFYLAAASMGPVILSIAIAHHGTSAFTPRYLLFAHVFFLAGLAVLVGRLPSPGSRWAAAAFLLVGFAVAHLRFWTKLDLAHRTGARGAVAELAGRRHSGEPVVVCSPLLYFSMIAHAGDRVPCRMYHDGRAVIHYHGAAVVTPDDFITGPELEALDAGRVWVVNMGNGAWGNYRVPIPPSWVEMSRVQFPEAYWLQGQITLLEYHTCGSPLNDRAPRITLGPSSSIGRNGTRSTLVASQPSLATYTPEVGGSTYE
jgi:uncharacterized membrane protein